MAFPNYYPMNQPPAVIVNNFNNYGRPGYLHTHSGQPFSEQRQYNYSMTAPMTAHLSRPINIPIISNFGPEGGNYVFDQYGGARQPPLQPHPLPFVAYAPMRHGYWPTWPGDRPPADEVLDYIDILGWDSLDGSLSYRLW